MQFLSGVHMLPLSRKCKNKIKKYSLIYVNIVCAHSNFHEKITFSWPMQKRQIKASRKGIFLFCIGRIKSWFFFKQLCEQVKREDIHAIFFVRIF
jgi:hypothetical protein